jgi:hypothetical protein
MGGSATVGAARIVFGADTSDFDSAARGIEGVLGKLVDRFRDVENRIKAIGVGITVGVTVPFGLVSKGAIRAASDAAEMQSAFAFTFGAMSASVEEWATRTGNAIGRSTQEMQGGALAFQQLFRMAAPTQQAAADLSKQFALLAQDLSSFFNVSPDEALNKLRSGLQGESEPLRDFGVFLNEDAVAAEALAMGLAKTKNALTDQDKVLARAALIVEATTAAQGDASRTADSFANRTRALSAAIDELKVKIGDILLPVATKLVSVAQRVVTWFSELPDGVHKTMVAFGALASALGPVVLILSKLAVFIVARIVAGFGLIGEALAFIIAPITTVINKLGTAGLMRVLGAIAARFAAFLGPVGWAIGAVILFKDKIVAALTQVWDRVKAAFGPPLERIMTKVQSLFETLSGGSIGSAIGTLSDLLSGLVDVIGTALGGVLIAFGELLARTVGAAMELLEGLVEIVRGVVDVIAALLSGDFAGAWKATVGVVESAVGAIVDAVVAMVPDMEVPLQAVYAAAKAWLADGFDDIGSWVATAVGGMVDYVASAFPGVVTAAKGVYAGVKGWLVDKFGALVDWIGNAAKFIGDKYAALKARLGLGDTPEAGGAEKPPALAPTPKRAADAEEPKKKKRETKKREPKARDPAEDARDREQLKLQTDLEAARLRGDYETERSIQKQLDFTRQIEAYQRTGMTLAVARAAAERDMGDLQAARVEGAAQERSDQELSHQIEVARIAGNRSLEESLAREEEIKGRIHQGQRAQLSLEEATTRAVRQQLEIDQAREAVRKRLFEREARERAVRLAELRGDSEEQIRAVRRTADIADRADRIRDRDERITEDDAREQAEGEWSEEEKARQTGVFRETFKNGVRAAMEGDLKGFVKNWWKDRVVKGMEEALNSLADLIASLFSKAGEAGKSSGGVLGAIGSVIGTAFGPKTTTVDASDVPAFATGGSFRVGGQSGIDRNLVAFRATRGEMVDIRRPGNDNGGGGERLINVTVNAQDAVLTSTVSGWVEQGVAAGIGRYDAGKGRRLRRTVPE